MIYRILIDDRCDVAMHRITYHLKKDAALVLGKHLPRKFAARPSALEGQIFDTHEQVIEALRSLIGPRRYCLVARYVLDLIQDTMSLDTIPITDEWRDHEDRVRTGPGNGYLADVMVERGMNAPAIYNKRARFYFTEKGWQTVGRYVATEARRLGHHVQVLKHKNPKSSRIVYADSLQVAVLPDKNHKILRSR